MKKSFLLFTGLIGFTALFAQVKEGTIVYERKINLHRNIRDEQVRAMVPEFRVSRYELFFSENESAYKVLPEDERPDPFAGGAVGGRMIINMSAGGSGDLYSNFEQARSIKTAEFSGKNYLVVDSIRKTSWKLGAETKNILGYTCTKATRTLSVKMNTGTKIITGNGAASITKDSTTQPQTKETEVVAWFAPDIMAPVGPDNFGQLPGAILQIDVDKGATVYTATEVKKTVDHKELKEPKKGKVITAAEYGKMVADAMSQAPAGTNMRMFN